MKIVPKYIVFVLSPSFGIIDTVAPILSELKETCPNLRVIGYFPRPEVISQAQDNPSLLKKLESCVDLIGIDSQISEKLILVPPVDLFSHPKSGKIFHFVPKALSRLFRLHRFVISIIASMHVRRFRNRRSIECGTLFTPSTTLVIGDFNEVSKEYMGCLRRHAKRVLFCGVNHGVDIDRRTSWTVHPHFNLFSRRHCFLFSNEEKRYYQSRFGLNECEISVFGVQKHEKLSVLRQSAPINSPTKKTELSDQQVLLISRPSAPSYLPASRKRRALRGLRKVIIEELGFKLLVKLHPKETEEQGFFDCLGPQDNGKRWAFVDESVEALGWQVAFSVCFYSGACTDMIMIGTPTIEYLDLTGLNELEGLGAVTMPDGLPALSYRAAGLVLGASNQQELRAMVKKIIDDPEACLLVCKNNYDKLFTEPKGSTVKTVEMVMKLFGEHQHNESVV